MTSVLKKHSPQITQINTDSSLRSSVISVSSACHGCLNTNRTLITQMGLIYADMIYVFN